MVIFTQADRNNKDSYEDRNTDKNIKANKIQKLKNKPNTLHPNKEKYAY